MSIAIDPASLDAETVALTQQLIRAESVSPHDAGCQALMSDYLGDLGFRIEAMPFGDVKNLWALHGQGGPCLCLPAIRMSFHPAPSMPGKPHRLNQH